MKYGILILISALAVFAETLFEVKDASNNKVLDISTDGLRVMNLGDTLMVISSSEIKAVLDNSKGLSRSFSVTTASSKGAGIDVMKLTGDSTRFWISDTGSGFGVANQISAGKRVGTNLLEVSTTDTKMREGALGERYTDFSPENIFIGLNSGRSTTPTLTNGFNNVFLGNGSGYTNILGSYNVFIGKDAGYSNRGNGTYLNGEYNVFMGYSAGYKNQSGSCNVFLGEEAGRENLTGSHNIYIGTETGRDNTAGDGNTCVGSDSFFGGSGDFNTYLGWLAGSYATGNNNIFIGTQSGNNETASNRLFIDNSGTAAPLIYGEFDNDSLRINGKLSVSGNSTISGKLGVGLKPVYNIHSEDLTTNNDNPTIFGKHNVTDAYGVGVRGEGGYRGVIGYASATSFECRGLYGIATGTGTGIRYGVYGEASGGTTNWAGYFAGDINVTGSVAKAADYLRIDHPLDPENKFLVHSGVSSSEMKNIYDGVVILDNNGKASVQLPDWFEALNTDFRYQMTAIGKPCPNLYVSKKISKNNFEIAGGEPNAEISWQITGVRKDSYALKNPIVQEFVKTAEDKNTDKGKK